jgi:hypothetical protein
MTKNLAASIRARLLAVAKSQAADFNQILVRFALERILIPYEPVRTCGSIPAQGGIALYPLV